MATSGANPTSSLLQDMLREKKAQTQRVKKTYDPNDLNDRDIQSSPIPSMSARDRSDAHSRRGSGIGIRNVTSPKGMGFKETEEYISKISKQNFDLKLGIFQVRQRNEVLEARLEKLQELEADNEELQSINEELLLELEKRDVAIQEAVGLICELEVKNEELQMTVVKMDFTQTSSTSGPEPVKEGTAAVASSLSPIPAIESNGLPDTDVQVDPQAPSSEHSLSAPDTLSPPKIRSARRVPNFIRETKKSTNVLRSLYSSDGNASFVSLSRPVSLFSGDDDDDDIDRPNSPRLSILSESGFSSIYGGHKDHIFGETDQGDLEQSLPPTPNNPPHRDTQRESRLHRWLDERNKARTPSPTATANDKIPSIGEVLSDVPASSQELDSGEMAPAGQPPCAQRTPEKRQAKQARSPEKRSASPSFGGPIFGSAVLPPTPDSMSTATLDANSSTPSIITEKSLLDGTPYLAKGYVRFLPDSRPHTSDSTNGPASPGSLRHTAQHDISAQSDARLISGSDKPMRPSLTSYATDVNGQSSSPTQASRNLSYPSPTGRPRRLSEQRSPTSYRGSDSNSEKTLNQSPQERLSSGRAGTITPTRRTARDDHRSPLSPQDGATASPITALPPYLAPSPQPQRSSSLRSKIASKFTRASSSNTSRIPNPSSNAQDGKPSRPSVIRAPASTQHARLPRPASLYGQHPVPAPLPSPCPSPTRDLSPILPEGTLTDLERYSASSARHPDGRPHRRR